MIPYFGYSRQDRKVAPRVPISAKLVADLITTAGASRVLTVDLHAGQIQGFFNIPVDNLYRDAGADPVPAQADGRPNGSRWSRPTPAASSARAPLRGGSMPTWRLSTSAGRRASEVAEMQLVGEVQDSIALLVDDMIDTAGTITEAAKVVIDAGATEVLACATHPILSDPACERLEQVDDQGTDHHQHASRCAPRPRRNCRNLRFCRSRGL